MRNQEALIAGGVVAAGAVLAYAVSRGSGEKTGVAYAQVNPASVAAVENGVAARIAAVNQASLDKAKLASDTLLGLVGAQTGLMTSQIQASTALDETRLATESALAQAQIASATALGEANINSQTQIQTTQLNTTAATQQAQITSDATVKAASDLASVQQAIAQINANATAEVARNQTTQAQAAAGAQKTSSFWSALGNIASAVLHFFSPAPSQSPTSTQVSYSPEVGPAPIPAGGSFG